MRSVVESPTKRRMVDAILTYEKMVRVGVIPDMVAIGRLLKVPPL